MVTKTCTLCGVTSRGLEDTLRLFHRAGKMSDGSIKFAFQCKKCVNSRGREKKYRYKYLYSLSYDETQEMKSKGCEVCGSHKNLCIDHDHNTGKVRGCLCGHCNRGIGHFLDDIGRVLSRSEYLKKHQPNL